MLKAGGDRQCGVWRKVMWRSMNEARVKGGEILCGVLGGEASGHQCLK